MAKNFSSHVALRSLREKQQQERLAKDISAYYGQIKERNIQKILVDFCEKAQIPYMRNRDVKLVQSKDGRLVPALLAESQRGKPDLTIVCPHGVTVWVETKAPGGKLRPEQRRWRDDLLKFGHEWHSPSTPTEAENLCALILKRWI
jgi:hypothetical protein